MNKKEAADFLGISERSLERYTSQNRLASRLEKGKTRPVVVYDEPELQRFKAELESSIHRGAVEHSSVGHSSKDVSAGRIIDASGQTPTDPANGTTALATFDGVSGFIKLLEGLQSQAAPPPGKPTAPIEAKLLLNLAEAQALTGLSRGVLREAIEDGSLKARQIGRSWRVKRSDLEAYIEQL